MRDWLYVEDHARALSLVARARRAGETYNVGGRQRAQQYRCRARRSATARRAMRPSRDGSQRRELITFVADRPGHDRRYAIDAAKIERELGWRAARELRDRACQDGALVSSSPARGGNRFSTQDTERSASVWPARPRQSRRRRAGAPGNKSTKGPGGGQCSAGSSSLGPTAKSAARSSARPAMRPSGSTAPRSTFRRLRACGALKAPLFLNSLFFHGSHAAFLLVMALAHSSQKPA